MPVVVVVMTDKKLDPSSAAGVVQAELGDIKAAFAPLLNGSELPLMTRLIANAEKRLLKPEVRQQLDKLAEAGTDPFKSFWVERPSMTQFKRSISVVDTVDEVYERLKTAGWILERHFDTRIFITFRIGQPINGKETH